MALDFQYVFRRIGVRPFHDEHEHFIDRTAVIGNDEAMLDRTVLALGQGLSRRAAENGIAYVIGMAAADTDDADAAFPRGWQWPRSYRSYRTYGNTPFIAKGLA